MAEYTPSEDDVERFYVDARYRRTHDDYAVTRVEFDRFLARVRRDAKAEAWTETCEAFAWCITNGPIEDALPYVAEHNPYREAGGSDERR